jgi:hypothetical protein
MRKAHLQSDPLRGRANPCAPAGHAPTGPARDAAAAEPTALPWPPWPPWEWPLQRGQAQRIRPAPVPRWLHVASGRVWLTPTRDDDLAADHWLDAGEGLPLPPGSAWVLEAWPAARVALHQATPAPALSASSQRFSRARTARVC